VIEPFPRQTGLIKKAPRDVSTRPRQAADEPSLNRIALQVERHDRYRSGGISRSPDTGRAVHEDHIDVSANEISGETRKGLQIRAREPDVESDRLALDVAKLA
jgi:hypothetical protein